MRHFSDIKMTSKTFHVPERDVESCEKDSDQDSEDDSPADVVFGRMLLRSASGRPVIRPNRLDL